jgi:hypothetical protein
VIYLFIDERKKMDATGAFYLETDLANQQIGEIVGDIPQE